MNGRILELGEGMYITGETEIACTSTIIAELLASYGLQKEGVAPHYKRVSFMQCFPPQELFRKGLLSPDVENWNDESHLVYADGDEVCIYATSSRGLLYGASALLQLTQGGYLRRVCAFFSPICLERGMKVFTPSRENIPFFKKFVDLLVFYRFNTIMIEIGGAMEYRRHPEINLGWVDYCKEMSEFSGKTTIIQDHTFPWYKNAIHMENGGGGFLNQDEMRDLVRYCRERGLEVIPEVPSLGHCDYLMMGNHDIAERPEDPYPDTYCPSNPKSYEILFDVIDEVISVFKPKRMNIGHDEFYTIAVCENCRHKSGAEIFATDVNRIADYLKSRNVKTMIWGDKLLKNAVVPDAGPFGGAEIPMYSPAFHRDGKFIGVMPATWQAIESVYRDVEILHWNWCLSATLEDEVLDAGFSVRYGNFDSYLFPNWHKHMKKNIQGAIISNWSTLNERILQRNGIFFNVAYASEMFWNPDFCEEDFETIRACVMEALYDRKNPERKKCVECKDAPHPDFVEITYNTDYHPAFRWFVDGVFPEDTEYLIGMVHFHYGDGSEEKLPVRYGDNIGYRLPSWERDWEPEQNMYRVDDHLIETTYGTLPIQIKGETFYRCMFENPHPEKELLQVDVQTEKRKPCSIFVSEIKKLTYRR